MRKYDVAYVPNGPANYYPAKELDEMSLDEIIAKYIKTCGKANGLVSVCSRCKNPCKQGKRAIQLLSNEVYCDPPIPLYGGKTLIEKAREENMLRRQAAEEEKKKEEEKKEKKINKKNMQQNTWWEESLASGDQVQWLIDFMKLSKTQAKKKIYMYKYNHGLLNKEPKEEKHEKKSEEVHEIKTETSDQSIESKIEILMKMQDDQKKAMEEYLRLYEEAKKEYEGIKQKVDVLCSALDILNN